MVSASEAPIRRHRAGTTKELIMAITIGTNDHYISTTPRTTSIKKIVAGGVLAAALGAGALIVTNVDSGSTPAAPQAVTAAQTAGFVSLQPVAEWAGENGFTGLSPASLRPTVSPFSSYEALATVAEWAQANGYSGLSPASMQIIDR
jgi:hypothetical protein